MAIMTVRRLVCDYGACGTFTALKGGDRVPDGWISVTIMKPDGEGRSQTETLQFCSLGCFKGWVGCLSDGGAA